MHDQHHVSPGVRFGLDQRAGGFDVGLEVPDGRCLLDGGEGDGLAVLYIRLHCKNFIKPWRNKSKPDLSDTTTGDEAVSINNLSQ